MKKHLLPDGRKVIIRKFKVVPPAVRQPSMNKGLAKALKKVLVGEYAEVEVGGGMDLPTRSINGNVRQFERDHGAKFELRDMGNGRVRVYRVG